MAQVHQVWQAKKNGTRWEAVNQVTGEVVPLAPLEGKRRWSEPHVWLFQDTIRRLAEDRTFGQQSTRVLLYLLSVLDWDNWLVVPHTAMGAALGLQAPNVSRAMADLIHRKVIEQGTPPSPRNAYRLNSAYAYKGSFARLRVRRRQERRRTQQQALCPFCGAGALYHANDGRWGCVACNQWLQEREE